MYTFIYIKSDGSKHKYNVSESDMPRISNLAYKLFLIPRMNSVEVWRDGKRIRILRASANPSGTYYVAPVKEAFPHELKAIIYGWHTAKHGKPPTDSNWGYALSDFRGGNLTILRVQELIDAWRRGATPDLSPVKTVRSSESATS